MSSIQCIKVKVEKARGLCPAVPTAPCNAYVTVGLRYAIGHDVPGEIHQTKVKNRNANPVFGQEFTLGKEGYRKPKQSKHRRKNSSR